VLHLEDDPMDAELIETALAEHDIPCSMSRVCTQAAFEAAIQQGGFDLILSDSKLPGYDTVSALVLARQRCPEVPSFFVSALVSPERQRRSIPFTVRLTLSARTIWQSCARVELSFSH